MSKRLTTDEFVAKARALHGDEYDYSRVVYTGRTIPVEIVCKTHGAFMQQPCVHLQSGGHGCPTCGFEKQRATNMKKYGVPVSSQAASVKAKQRATCEVRYGGGGPQSSPDVRAKSVATNLARYGVENPMGVPEFREKIRLSNLMRFGVDWAAQCPEIRAKQVATCVARYGSAGPLSSKSVREKGVQTSLLRYGTRFPMQCEAVVARGLATRRENGTFGTSDAEELLYRRLCNWFGFGDVVRQYKSSRYPFACDFYVKSRDLYIELNAYWSHNGHWFEADNVEDAGVVRAWEDRFVAGKPQYGNALTTWTVRDVEKRETARKHNLNYVVFWDNHLRDADIWFDLNCPDGRDWDEPWSWFDSDREVSE